MATVVDKQSTSSKPGPTLDGAVKKIGLDIYKAVSENMESLAASGKIRNIDSNSTAKQISDWAQRELVDNWSNRDEAREFQKKQGY